MYNLYSNVKYILKNKHAKYNVTAYPAVCTFEAEADFSTFMPTLVGFQFLCTSLLQKILNKFLSLCQGHFLCVKYSVKDEITRIQG